MNDFEMSALTIYNALLTSVNRDVPVEKTDFDGLRKVAVREAGKFLLDCHRAQGKVGN